MFAFGFTVADAYDDGGVNVTSDAEGIVYSVDNVQAEITWSVAGFDVHCAHACQPNVSGWKTKSGGGLTRTIN